MAGFKYEKNGVLVATPKGHKRWGWAVPYSPCPPMTWKPASLRSSGGK